MQRFEGEEQLSLFGSGGLDLGRLKARRESLRGKVRAIGTMRSYKSDWAAFCSWCREAGRVSLPATPDTIALYVTWQLTDCGKRSSSVSRHLASIADAHRREKVPTPPMADAREVINAVRRERHEKPQGKAALQVMHLARMAKSCDAKTNIGSRDRAIIVLGFATSLRRADIAKLNLEDVTFEKKGLAVFVHYEKNDQVGRGRAIGVWAGQRACTDPVRVLKAWIKKRGKWPGPLFCRIQRYDKIEHTAVSGEAINAVVKRAVTRIGLDAGEFGAHSLRAGAATTAAELGRSDQEIMCLTGHNSPDVMRGYIRRARLFSGRNPLAGVL